MAAQTGARSVGIVTQRAPTWQGTAACSRAIVGSGGRVNPTTNVADQQGIVATACLGCSRQGGQGGERAAERPLPARQLASPIEGARAGLSVAASVPLPGNWEGELSSRTLPGGRGDRGFQIVLGGAYGWIDGPILDFDGHIRTYDVFAVCKKVGR